MITQLHQAKIAKYIFYAIEYNDEYGLTDKEIQEVTHFYNAMNKKYGQYHWHIEYNDDIDGFDVLEHDTMLSCEIVTIY